MFTNHCISHTILCAVIYFCCSMWCEHGDVMAKLLPLFLDYFEGIDVVQSAMAEQFEKCIQWYVKYYSMEDILRHL
jgi:hypothetical protein